MAIFSSKISAFAFILANVVRVSATSIAPERMLNATETPLIFPIANGDFEVMTETEELLMVVVCNVNVPTLGS